LDMCLPVDPPLYFGRLPAPCPVTFVALSQWIEHVACVLVPDLREVVLHIIVASRWTPLWVCHCDRIALAALPRTSAHIMWLLISRQPRSRFWSRMLLTIKARGPSGCLDPKRCSLRNGDNRVHVLPLSLHSYVVGYATL